MKFGVASTGFEAIRMDDMLDLDTRGKPTKRAVRVHAHAEMFGMSQEGSPVSGFGAVLAGKRTLNATPAAMQRPMPAPKPISTDLTKETIELTAKHRPIDARPAPNTPFQPFEIERTVGGATAERDPNERRKPPKPLLEPDESSPRKPQKPFKLEKKPQSPAAATPFVQVAINEEMSEWENALLLPEEKPGVVPLISRATKQSDEAEPVLLSGRGPQRGALPTLRRPSLPEPRVPSTKIIANATKPGLKRAFSSNAMLGGAKDPRGDGRKKFTTGGHAGRV